MRTPNRHRTFSLQKTTWEWHSSHVTTRNSHSFFRWWGSEIFFTKLLHSGWAHLTFWNSQPTVWACEKQKRDLSICHMTMTEIRKTLKWVKKRLKRAAKNEMKWTGVISFTLPSIYSQIKSNVTPKFYLSIDHFKTESDRKCQNLIKSKRAAQQSKLLIMLGIENFFSIKPSACNRKHFYLRR